MTSITISTQDEYNNYTINKKRREGEAGGKKEERELEYFSLSFSCFEFGKSAADSGHYLERLQQTKTNRNSCYKVPAAIINHK